uniref:Putative leucine-rich repeat protein, plant-type n=1 Tax=Helianthus annuus TaxID=4232 RepID=A0A251UBB4_HELAN
MLENGSVGSPDLTGWTATAGDPCDEKWQGVVCDTTNTNIISITVHGANSVRESGDTLGAFSFLQSM